MSERWPYDPDTLARVADRLYALLPEFYRASDQAPNGRGELAEMLRTMAAPLAVVRQSIEELHADLFIDSCSDPAIALLADLVGVRLVFPDPASNRVDVRNTVRWRRRKGTPAMLEEMGGALSERLSVLAEGWRLVAMTQDINQLRRDRALPDARSPRLREQSGGPLDAGGHLVDVRAIGPGRGGHHPRHVVHWVHPSQFFTVSSGEAPYIGTLGDPTSSSTTTGTETDWHYAFHPMGKYRPLRARRVSADDDLGTDRIGAMAFASDPSAYFGKDGRFTVRVAGLPAGVAVPSAPGDEPVLRIADASLLPGSGAVAVLDFEGRRFRSTVEIALCAVPVPASGAAVPNLGQAQARAGIELSANGPANASSTNPTLAANTIPMLRLRAVGATGAFFPGATVALTGGTDVVRRAHTDTALAQTGQLRGAVVAELPPIWVLGDTFLHVTADGTIALAKVGDDVIALDRDGDKLSIDRRRVLRIGVGPAWPRLALSSDAERLADVVPAPERPPAILHGGTVLNADGSLAPSTRSCKLLFAIVYDAPGNTPAVELIGSLAWQGSDPNGASRAWTLLDQGGSSTTDPARRIRELLAKVSGQLPGMRLGVRLVADAAAILTPAELSWAALDGDALLVHLPELPTQSSTASPWLPGGVSSDVVVVARDGATWWDAGGLARMATSGGATSDYPRGIAPLASPVFHRRRRVRGRRLCAWQNETTTARLTGTPAGFLDVDVEFGLFAFALTEPPQVLPRNSASRAVPNVTVDCQDGATLHIGARPAARVSVLGSAPAKPTRIVSRAGAYPIDTPYDLSQVPRYTRIRDAMAAIAASAANGDEVVEIIDSAIYLDDLDGWPAGPRSLTLQASEGARPVIRQRSVKEWSVPAGSYARFRLRGIAIGNEKPDAAELPAALALPSAADVELALCSVLTAQTPLSFTAPTGGARVAVRRCLTGPLQLAGTGVLDIDGSVLDIDTRTATAPSVAASGWKVDLDRSTIFGRVDVRALEASESIFLGAISVVDRFHGCIRYSRVAAGSVLPQQHRLAPVGTPVLFVSIDRLDPAYARLAERCSPNILRGAADGGEMGAFHDTLWSVRNEAFLRRLAEFTPAGLETGVVRVD